MKKTLFQLNPGDVLKVGDFTLVVIYQPKIIGDIAQVRTEVIGSDNMSWFTFSGGDDLTFDVVADEGVKPSSQDEKDWQKFCENN